MHRSTVYVEGDAIMNNFTDAEGKSRNVLRIYQSMINQPLCCLAANANTLEQDILRSSSDHLLLNR